MNARFYTNTTEETRKRITKMSNQELDETFKELARNNVIRNFLSKALEVSFSDKELHKFKDQQKRLYVAYLLDNKDSLEQELKGEIDKHESIHHILNEDLKYVQSI